MRKGTTLKTKAERTMRQINSRWPGNPVWKSGIPPDHCWERGLPPYIPDCWLEVRLWEAISTLGVDPGRITGKPEVIGSPVGLGPGNAHLVIHSWIVGNRERIQDWACKLTKDQQLPRVW